MGRTKNNDRFKKYLAFLFPVLLLGLFVLVMDSTPLLKKPLDNRQQISSTLDKIEKDIKNENWDSATSDVRYLRISFKESFKYLQFSVERDEMTRIISNLDRIDGFIIVKDKKGALGELYEAKGHWREMGK